MAKHIKGWWNLLLLVDRLKKKKQTIAYKKTLKHDYINGCHIRYTLFYLFTEKPCCG